MHPRAQDRALKDEHKLENIFLIAYLPKNRQEQGNVFWDAQLHDELLRSRVHWQGLAMGSRAQTC